MILQVVNRATVEERVTYSTLAVSPDVDLRSGYSCLRGCVLR
jgi:hypothetical protein